MTEKNRWIWFKVNNKHTKTTSWQCSDVGIFNYELLSLFKCHCWFWSWFCPSPFLLPVYNLKLQHRCVVKCINVLSFYRISCLYLGTACCWVRQHVKDDKPMEFNYSEKQRGTVISPSSIFLRLDFFQKSFLKNIFIHQGLHQPHFTYFASNLFILEELLNLNFMRILKMLSRQEKYHKKVIKDIWYMNQVLFFLLKFIGAMPDHLLQERFYVGIGICILIPSRHLLILSQQRKHHKILWYMFKVDNKDTRTMSMTSPWCIFSQVWTNFCLNNVFMFLLLTLDKSGENPGSNHFQLTNILKCARTSEETIVCKCINT